MRRFAQLLITLCTYAVWPFVRLGTFMFSGLVNRLDHLGSVLARKVRRALAPLAHYVSKHGDAGAFVASLCCVTTLVFAAVLVIHLGGGVVVRTDVVSKENVQWFANLWRNGMTLTACCLGVITCFGAATAWRVRRILRSEYKGWERLLPNITREISDANGEQLRMLVYTPNAGDISLRKNPIEHADTFEPFQEALVKYIKRCSCCEIICLPDSSIDDMLLGLRAYGDKRSSTYDLIRRIDGCEQATVWRMEQIPPQHFFIIGRRVGYRFLVKADAGLGLHEVRAIRSEDGDEVDYMNAVWETSSADLAHPMSGDFGFWITLGEDGTVAHLWGKFQEQSHALAVEVQGCESPEFRQGLPCWQFAWPPGGVFCGNQGQLVDSNPPHRPVILYNALPPAPSAIRPPTGLKYFRTRIVKNKKKSRSGDQFVTEWSRPLRLFLPVPRLSEQPIADKHGLMRTLRKRAETNVATAMQLPVRLTSPAVQEEVHEDVPPLKPGLFPRNPFIYEFVYSYPPRVTLGKVVKPADDHETEAVSDLDQSAQVQLFEAGRPAFGEIPGDSPSLAVYVHYPFCYDKCAYCHYCAEPRSKAFDKLHPYMKALETEISRFSTRFADENREVTSVYFGGGTPTTMQEDELEVVLRCLRSNFRISKECEVTVECSPSSARKALFTFLKSKDVTRLSLGVQSFDNELLHELRRDSNEDSILRGLEDARSAGFERVNIDLLYGLPSHTLKWIEKWEYSLQRTCEVMPSSVTLYQLRVKKNSELGTWDRKCFPGISDTLTMSAMAREILPNVGYVEVAPDFFLLDELHQTDAHFFGYQRQKAENESFVGFGASAYSFYRGALYNNTSSLDEYLAVLADSTNPRRLPIESGAVLTKEDLWRRFSIMSLRYGPGIDIERAEQRYGKTEAQAIQSILSCMVDLGLFYKTNQLYRLSSTGCLFVDEICTLFYSEPVRTLLAQNGRVYGAYIAEGIDEPLSAA